MVPLSLGPIGIFSPCMSFLILIRSGNLESKEISKRLSLECILDNTVVKKIECRGNDLILVVIGCDGDQLLFVDFGGMITRFGIIIFPFRMLSQCIRILRFQD